jgi:hypothetical protein
MHDAADRDDCAHHDRDEYVEHRHRTTGHCWRI